MASQRHLLMRLQNGDGTSNDWAVAVIGEAIVIRFGKTGAKMTQREIPRGSWKAAPAREEANRRINEQTEAGYAVIGTCRFNELGMAVDVEREQAPQGWVHAVRRTGERTRAERLFFFEIKAATWRSMSFVLDPVGRKLQGHCAIVYAGREGLPQAYPVIDGWGLRFDGHSGTGAVNVTGTIDRGAPPSALILLLALRSQVKEVGGVAGDGQVGISITDAVGNPVELTIRDVQKALTVFGPDVFEQERDFLTEIGVIPRVVLLGDRVKKRYVF